MDYAKLELSHSVPEISTGMLNHNLRWRLDPTTEAPAPGYGPWRKTCPWQAAMDVASHRDEITFILDGWGVTYISHSIYGTGIFTYIYHKIQPNVNVGKYTIPMASMGIQCQHINI